MADAKERSIVTFFSQAEMKAWITALTIYRVERLHNSPILLSNKIYSNANKDMFAMILQPGFWNITLCINI